ncbi:MAG: short-chain dehydrogenase [Phototrophicales bacterium]|nr:MAG: short-chain dehydrogenase [Phototrophicales bacterium]
MQNVFLKGACIISEFSQRVVMITGGSRGIGGAIARGFGAEGARVVINHFKDDNNAADTAAIIRESGGETLTIDADVADSSQVGAMVAQVIETWGRIDILVCNAGICPFYDFLDISEEIWDRTLDVNLKGVFLVSQAVARHMVERGGGGRIIATSSISSMVGGTQQAHYCASKAGINLLIKSMALSLAPHQITCNAVLPGTVETALNRDALQDAAARIEYERKIPLGRVGQPDDITGAVMFLASQGAQWMTGSLIVVDGGTTSAFQ